MIIIIIIKNTHSMSFQNKKNLKALNIEHQFQRSFISTNSIMIYERKYLENKERKSISLYLMKLYK